jgi:hypothetical protein
MKLFTEKLIDSLKSVPDSDVERITGCLVPEPITVICIIGESSKLTSKCMFEFGSSLCLESDRGFSSSAVNEARVILEDMYDASIMDEFVEDFVRVVGDNIGYHHHYKQSFKEMVRHSHYPVFIVEINDEFGVDWYMNNISDVHYIFVNDGSPIPHQDDKCNVLQMYDTENQSTYYIDNYKGVEDVITALTEFPKQNGYRRSVR